MPQDHARLFLDDCNGWIKSHIRHYTDRYFPCSKVRPTKNTLQDLKCPLCAQPTAWIHLKHDRVSCDCLERPLKMIDLVNVIESNPIQALEELTGLRYVRPVVKTRSRRR